MLVTQCAVCAKSFGSTHALQNHARAKGHAPAAAAVNNGGVSSKPYTCPKCNRGFRDAQAVTQHLESSKCGPGGEAIHGFLSQAASAFTVPQIAYPCGGGGGGAVGAGVVAPFPPGTVTATEEAFNAMRQMYECGLCHKFYRTLHQLNAHLARDTHYEQLYRCGHCPRTFAKASALVGHIERQACGTPVTLREMLLNMMLQLTDGSASAASIPARGIPQPSKEDKRQFVIDCANNCPGVYQRLSENTHHPPTLFFMTKDPKSHRDVKVDVYYTTGTIKTAMDHPSQGKTQMFGKGGLQFTFDDILANPSAARQRLQEIFLNPRVHTGNRYRRRRR